MMFNKAVLIMGVISSISLLSGCMTPITSANPATGAMTTGSSNAEQGASSLHDMVWRVKDAAGLSNFESVLKNGTSPNMVNKEGRTVLHEAIEAGLLRDDKVGLIPDIVKVLMANGADPEIKDAEGYTVLQNICRHIKSGGGGMSGSDRQHMLALWEISGNAAFKEALDKELAAKNLVVKDLDEIVWSPIVQTLLSGGAKAGTRDPNGHTALYWATVNNFGQIAELLKGSGTDTSELAALSTPVRIVLTFEQGLELRCRMRRGAESKVVSATPGSPGILELLPGKYEVEWVFIGSSLCRTWSNGMHVLENETWVVKSEVTTDTNGRRELSIDVEKCSADGTRTIVSICS